MALSGGPDSMALLALLAAAGPEREMEILAAHFDHGLREGSRAEAERVVGWARGLGVRCRVGRPDGPLERSQAAFREARYRFLRRVADREGADRIATAHQADDQAETVLFRILRGTGLRGLAGIPVRRGRLVRPLLPFARAELRAWLEAEGVPFLRDPSNRDPRWARSRIRHDVLPALERAAGEPVRPRLTALAEVARRADEGLEAAARDLLRDALLEGSGSPGPGGSGWPGSAEPPEPPGPEDSENSEGARAPAAPRRLALSRDALVDRHPELWARALRILARRLGARLRRRGTRVGVQFIKRGRSGTGVSVGEGLRLWREFDVLWLGEPPAHEPDETLEIGPGSGASTVSIGGRPLRVRWQVGPAGDDREEDDGSGKEPGPPRWAVALRLPDAAFPLTLRGPRPGDRIRLRGGTRKLKKVLGDARVPLSARPRRPVLADAEGRVQWVAGLATAAGLALPEGGEGPGLPGVGEGPARDVHVSLGVSGDGGPGAGTASGARRPSGARGSTE